MLADRPLIERWLISWLGTAENKLIEATTQQLTQWESLPPCFQRSTISLENRIVGTLCACPAGEHTAGIGCVRSRTSCAIAKRWERELKRITE